MNGPNWNVFVTTPRFPAISYQVLCGRSRTRGRHSPAGGSLSLGMGSERNWLRSPSRFALSLCHVCREGCDLSASCLHPLWPCLPPGIRTQPLEPKVKRNSSFPKLISSVCFFTESEEQLIHPLGLYGTRYETVSE